jgi:uncharacterized phage infection (PIP) family protein YhgE
MQKEFADQIKKSTDEKNDLEFELLSLKETMEKTIRENEESMNNCTIKFEAEIEQLNV